MSGIDGAIAVGAYIGLVSVWGAPVTGASMNPARSSRADAGRRRPEQLLHLSHRADSIGAMVAVAFEYILKGKATKAGAEAAQGILDEDLHWPVNFV